MSGRDFFSLKRVKKEGKRKAYFLEDEFVVCRLALERQDIECGAGSEAYQRVVDAKH